MNWRIKLFHSRQRITRRPTRFIRQLSQRRNSWTRSSLSWWLPWKPESGRAESTDSLSGSVCPRWACAPHHKYSHPTTKTNSQYWKQVGKTNLNHLVCYRAEKRFVQLTVEWMRWKDRRLIRIRCQRGKDLNISNQTEKKSIIKSIDRWPATVKAKIRFYSVPIHRLKMLRLLCEVCTSFGRRRCRSHSVDEPWDRSFRVVTPILSFTSIFFRKQKRMGGRRWEL